MSLAKKSFYIVLTVLVLWAAGFLWFLGTATLMSPQRIDQNTDAIVVLTGGSQRIETGLALFAAGKAGHLFITGVHPDVSEAEITAKWTGDKTLPRCCLTLGQQATTTVQNARETEEWLENHDYSSIRLVTSHYHMQRAMMEFHHRFPALEIIPHPVKQADLGPSQRWYWVLMVTEYHKTLYRWLTLLFEPPPPREEGTPS